MPPAPGGGKKKTGLIIGAVAVVAAVAVGAYFVVGSGSGGSSDVADDGPHKLTTPATVLTEYKKAEDGADGMSKSDLKDAESWGVKNPKDVSASYQSGDKDNPLAGKVLSFGGVYGDIEDPEKAVDGMFAFMEKESRSGGSDEDVKLVGSPKAYEPASLDGAVLKCQEANVDNSGGSTGEPKNVKMTMCVWGDHSTIGFVMPMELSDIAAGKSADPAEAAETTAKLRKEVRVKI
jgi:hypothetical protein